MTIEAAISLLLALIQNAGAISQLISQAQAAGQTSLPADAWNTILANDNNARAALANAIATALASAPKTGVIPPPTETSVPKNVVPATSLPDTPPAA